MKANKIIKTRELLEKLKGMHSISSVASIMQVSKKKAIYYVYRLRKQGYVKTRKNPENKSIYYISFENKLGGESYIDVINNYSPIKVSFSQDYKAYGRKIIPEEALVFALKTKELRIILASLALFKRINNWTELYKIAKLNNLKRQIGALYDLSKSIIKVRKMPKRFRKNILPRGDEKYEFMIDKLKSDDFKDIEKLWKVYLPFNVNDLEEYKA